MTDKPKAPDEIWRHEYHSTKFGVQGFMWNDVKMDDTDIRYARADIVEKQYNELLDVSNKNNDRHLEITELRDALRMFEINSHKDHRQVTENAKLIVKTNARLEKENKA